jgi:hypothetical protein
LLGNDPTRRFIAIITNYKRQLGLELENCSVRTIRKK